MAMITLYGTPRSRTMRVMWMLEELELPYELAPVDFVTGTKQPEFHRINPNGHIPVLRDGDLVLWESLAINLYLARRYDGGLWPKTPEDEGRTYQWSLWAMTEAEEPLLTALMHRQVLPPEERDAAKADDAAERFTKPLGVLDGALADRDYLLGSTFTVADLNVASVLSWAPLAKLNLSAAPHAAGWLRRCTGRAAFARLQKKL
jgi:glutathione S-transferase